MRTLALISLLAFAGCKAGAEPASDASGETDAVTDTNSGADTDSRADTDAEEPPDADTDAEVPPDAVTDTEVESDAVTDAEVDSDADTDAGVDSDAVTDAEVDSDADTDAGVPPDAETDADTGTDADTDADPAPRTCEEISMDYLSLETNQPCAVDADCQLLTGQCSVGLGGCCFAANLDTRQEQLDELGREYFESGCMESIGSGDCFMFSPECDLDRNQCTAVF